MFFFYYIQKKEYSEEGKAVAFVFLVHSGLQGPCSYLIFLTVNQKNEHNCKSWTTNFYIAHLF